VGLSSRTNADACRQLATILEPFGYRVDAISVRDCLHLKTAVSALEDDRVLLDPRLVDAGIFGGISRIEIDAAEPSAANVICIDDTVLCSADAPRTRGLLEAQGYRVVPVDASELAKAEAGLTCCSLLFHA